MVIVSIGGGIVLSTDINDGVTGLKKGWISSSDKLRGAVCGEQSKHVHRQSLVRVEVAIVGTDGDRGGLESFRACFCHSEGIADHTDTWEVGVGSQVLLI